MTYNRFGSWGMLIVIGTLLVLHAWSELAAFAVGTYLTACIFYKDE